MARDSKKTTNVIMEYHVVSQTTSRLQKPALQLWKAKQPQT
jgi:hypothetical protein